MSESELKLFVGDEISIPSGSSSSIPSNYSSEEVVYEKSLFISFGFSLSNTT